MRKTKGKGEKVPRAVLNLVLVLVGPECGIKLEHFPEAAGLCINDGDEDQSV